MRTPPPTGKIAKNKKKKGVQRALWKKRTLNESNERSQAANAQRELWEGSKRRSVGSTGVVNGVKGEKENI